MREVVFSGWEPEEAPQWLITELMVEPLVREYGFAREYWLGQEPRIVEMYLEVLELRARRQRQIEAKRNASR